MTSILNRVSSFFKYFFFARLSESKLVERFFQSRRASLEALESRELLAAHPYPNYYGPPTFEEYQAFFTNEASADSAFVAQSSVAESPVITIDVAEANTAPESVACLPFDLSSIRIEELDETDELIDSILVEENFASESSEATEVLLDLSQETLALEDKSDNLNRGGDSTQSGGSGGGASGGSGGSDLLQPYVSGGGGTEAYYDIVLNANANSVSMTGGWCISPDPSCQVTYSFQSSLNIVSVSIDSSNGNFTLTPTGIRGEGSFTVTGSNGYGSCVATVYVHCYSLSGFIVKEQTYGSNSWQDVYDKNSDNSNEIPWRMLWRENQYRWTPTFTNNSAPDNIHVRSVSFYSKIKGSNDGYVRFASGSYSPTPDSGGASSDDAPLYWPSVIGTPSGYGEKDIAVRVALSGCSFRFDSIPCIGVSQCELTLNPPETANQFQPRIAVNEINSVVWATVDGETNAIQYSEITGSETQSICFPERLNEDSDEVANQIKVVVSIKTFIPQGMRGSVFINYFDPLNPYGSATTIPYDTIDGKQVQRTGCGSRDNNGGISSITKTKLEYVSAADSTVLPLPEYFGWTFDEAVITFGQANPGDNYIIAAHPNDIVTTKYKLKDSNSSSGLFSTLAYSDPNSSDGYCSLPTSLFTRTLTVWRTLHIEKKQMKAFNSVTNMNETAPFALTNGFVATELTRACVEVREYDTDTDDEIDYSYVDKTDFSSAKPNPYNIQRKHDLQEPEYWNILAIGAFNEKSGTALGIAFRDTFYVFNAKIKEYANKHNLSIENIQRITALHEIGHTLGIADDSSGLGIMSYPDNYDTGSQIISPSKTFA